MDPMTNMITMDILTKKEYSPRDWLIYYKNVWIRNTIARTIDVDTDRALKNVDPETMVDVPENGQVVPVKVRLESRKISVQDGLDIIAAIDRLLASLPEGQTFESKYWSKEALKVDDDMMPKDGNLEDKSKNPESGQLSSEAKV